MSCVTLVYCATTTIDTPLPGVPLRLLPAQPSAFVRVHKEVVRLGLHPNHKRLQLRMRQQRLDCCVFAGQLGFAQQRMDLAVTHPVQELGAATALALGHQMVCVALRRRNHTFAQRAGQNSRRPGVHCVYPA